MQAHDDNFFYSNSRMIIGSLEKERQLLAEEQKLCRARTRRFFLETQRRRNTFETLTRLLSGPGSAAGSQGNWWPLQRQGWALEERRKLWDIHEQRHRENALQQRRQKVQEATERFQRAHLPPSQRRRQSYKNNAPTLEDALNHIQSNLLSESRQSVSISRSHSASPKTTLKPKPSPRKALSAVEAYTKLLQERSVISLRNTSDVHELQEKPSNGSPQEDSLSDCIHSESISSKDSLDSEEPKHGTKYLHSLSPAFLLDTDKCLSDLKKHFQPPAYPTETLPGDTLTQSRKLLELKVKKQKDYDLLRNKNGPGNSLWGIAKDEKVPRIDCIGDCGVTKNSTNDSIIVSTHIPHINTEPDTPFSPKQECALDLRQHKANDDRQLKHPSATEILLPTKNGNSTDYLFGTSKPNVVLNNCTMDYTCQEQAGKDNLCVSSRKDLSASINNFNKTSDADDKTVKKKINTELIHHTCLNINPPNSFKCLKCCEKEEPLSPVSPEASQRICRVTFIKGILKKHSKYISGDAACVCNSRQLTFTKQVALAIHDSVELTRAKNRDLANNAAVKKKLRWFDEVHADSADKGQNTIKQIRSKSSSLLHSKNNSEDHQLSIASVLGAIKERPSLTHTVPNGYHFTRHAWADVGVQVSLPQQHGDEVKVQQRNSKSSGLNAGTKERAEAGPVSSRSRKGTHIRPQSATEVSQIARAHGRLVMPRPPPPRTEATEEQKGFVNPTPYGTSDHAKVNCRPAEEHGSQREGPETCHPVFTNNELRTDNGLLFMPHPPSYTCTNAESNTKSKPRSGHQDTSAATGHRDKSPCLKCTPTEEEISKLWLNVRTALATKDAQAALRHRVVESTSNGRKNSATLSFRKLPHSTQPTKQADPSKQFSFTPALTGEIQNCGQQSWVDTKDPQRNEALHQQQQQGFATISMEEQRILQSLDRLNHRLHYIQEKTPDGQSFIGIRNPYITDLNSTSPQKLQAAAYQPQCQKKH